MRNVTMRKTSKCGLSSSGAARHSTQSGADATLSTAREVTEFQRKRKSIEAISTNTTTSKMTKRCVAASGEGRRRRIQCFAASICWGLFLLLIGNEGGGGGGESWRRFIRPGSSSIGGIFCEAAEEMEQQEYPDYYKILQLTEKATIAEIKKQYRTLSKQWHPDINKEDPKAQEKFTQIAQAYEVLSNKEERAKYDSLGPQRYHMEKGGRGGGGDDFWGDFPFSFFGGGRKRGREKAPNLKMRLYVTLEQLYFGDLLHVTFRRPVLCLHVEECVVPRKDCVAEKTKVVQQQVGPGFIVQNHVHDDTCVAQNKGWKRNCSQCPNGTTEMDNTFVSAYIEPGMKSGDVLDFHGIGWQMLGHDAGDLLLELVELPNDIDMHRQGAHLRTELSVTLLEALVGFEKTIKHINGKDVKVKRKIVTADGEVEVLKGHGMPISGREGQFGDLFVTLKVHFPVELSERQREKAREALGSVTEWKYTVQDVRASR